MASAVPPVDASRLSRGATSTAPGAPRWPGSASAAEIPVLTKVDCAARGRRDRNVPGRQVEIFAKAMCNARRADHAGRALATRHAKQPSIPDVFAASDPCEEVALAVSESYDATVSLFDDSDASRLAALDLRV